MRIVSPLGITSRLMPGLTVRGQYPGEVSIEYSSRAGDRGRTRYTLYVDTPGGEYRSDALQSGCGGGDLQAGMESLLSFITHAGDVYRGRMARAEPLEPLEDSTSFPEHVAEWAYLNDSELQVAACVVGEQRCIFEDDAAAGAL